MQEEIQIANYKLGINANLVLWTECIKEQSKTQENGTQMISLKPNQYNSGREKQ